MTKSMITGAAGLIGSHLAESLSKRGDALVATYFKPTIDIREIQGRVALRELDVRDRAAVEQLVREEQPNHIYHLAAQSLPTVSWSDPWLTLDTNIIGTVNVFEAIRVARTEDPTYDPMVVVACSSAEYGSSLTPERLPIAETAPLLPLHPYGVSKVGQDLLAYQYFMNYGIRCVRARIFNCTGPRKRNDVVSDFAASVLQAERTGQSVRVGNLETRRAIIDVRDMVSALTALADGGEAGETYNICADRVVQIGEVLQLYFEALGRTLDYVVAPELLRPSDELVIVGSTEKLRRRTGWRPTIALEKTIADVLAYERDRGRS